MTNEELGKLAIERLKGEYSEAECSLDYKDPLQLLIATRLAAQCTDARVNIVTKDLFKRFRSLDDFADADILEVERYIRPCGFYHMKARDIVGMCQMIRGKFGGKVPDTIEELTQLPGIGRKTANLIIGDVYGKPAVVVDTHCIRLTRRLGFHNLKDAVKIENTLREALPPEESKKFCHRLVLHGRAVCKAQKPRCEECVLRDICKYYNEQKK